jgi:hypothetical protein
MTPDLKLLFPTAKDEDDPVTLYSLAVKIGVLKIVAPIRVFRFSRKDERAVWLEFWGNYEPLEGWPDSTSFRDAGEAKAAVECHTTSLPSWDRSGIDFTISPEWKREVSEHVIFNHLDQWMRRLGASLRDMTDYFERHPTGLVDRCNISEFLEQMMVSGQIDRLPSDEFAPAELDRVVSLARKMGIPVGGEPGQSKR